jgi:tRNA pseudouridine55 synthase
VERVRTALAAFEGEIEQVPPMFSALHVGGRRLHELARAGVEVARPPRRVRIDRIELLDWTSPLLAIRVACGTGTYIRTLAADLGAALGCGGSLDALRRTRLGPFSLTTAVGWDLLRSGTAEQLAARVEPPDHALLHLPAVQLDEAAAQRLRHGQRVLPEHLEHAPTVVGRCRLYAAELFLGIGEVEADGVRALRLMHASNPRARSVSP